MSKISHSSLYAPNNSTASEFFRVSSHKFSETSAHNPGLKVLRYASFEKRLQKQSYRLLFYEEALISP
jgi:hypothetical protein